jgi:hypothetical protein
MTGWTKVWPRRNGLTIPLMVGLALVLAGTLILVMVLSATGEEYGRAGTLSPSADAGTVTVPNGSRPASGEGAGGRRASHGDAPEQAAADGTTDAESPGSGDLGSGAPGPAVPGSPGTEEPDQGSGGSTVSVGDLEVTLDPEEPSVTLSIDETEVTVHPGELLP